MTTDIIAETLAKMMPHVILLKDDFNPLHGNVFVKTIGSKEYAFYSHRRPVPDLNKLFEYVSKKADEWCEIDLGSKNLEREYISRKIAIKWLQIKYSNKYSVDIDWANIIDFLIHISNRTYENLQTVSNYIMRKDKKGTVKLAEIEEREGKVLDLMASSNYTYIELGTDLSLVGYNCVDIGEINTKETYNSVPDFLYPYFEILGCDLGLSATHAGDILIYDREGLLFTLRKGVWTIYENAQLKNVIMDVLGCKYGIACNIFDLIWNISYRRHGALVIVSSEGVYETHIINKESILNIKEISVLRKNILNSINEVSVLHTGVITKKAILMEMVSMDGSVVIDKTNGKVLSFGSIIETHPNAVGVSGARSTAGKSAIYHGNMAPCKVSSDGDITMYFKEYDTKSKTYIFMEYKFC